MAPDSTKKDLNATSDDINSDHSKTIAFDPDIIQARVDSILYEVRSHHQEWNVGQIVSALSEAGMLLIEHPPLESLEDRIDFDALLMGLNAAVYLIRGVLLQADMPSPRELMSVQRQFVCIIVLSAYAQQGDLLINTATALYNEVVGPFADWFMQYETQPIIHILYSRSINLLTLFCLRIGFQELVERKNDPPTDEEVKEIMELASNIFVSSPSGTGTRWLRDYLRRHRGASWLTDEELTIDQEE